MRPGLCITLALLAASAELLAPTTWAKAPTRLSPETSQHRIEAVQEAIRARVNRIERRYGYKVVHKTISGLVSENDAELGNATKAIGTRIYALWTGLELRIDGELNRLNSNLRMHSPSQPGQRLPTYLQTNTRP